MTSKKRLWKTVLLSTLMSMILLTACSSNNGNSPNEGDSGNGGKPATIKIFTQAYATSGDLKDNTFTKFIEQKFNVKIEWNSATADTFEEKKKLLMASGDYPDIFMAEKLFTKQEQFLYGQQGILAPLNDLIEQYGSNIKEAVMKEYPDFLQANTAPDGNIYGLPAINDCYHCQYSQKMWINTKWLDNLGLAMPTTTDEFYEAMKAFKEKDPNGNGIADEIPLSGTEKGWHGNVDGFLMNAFIYNDSEGYLAVNDGKVEFVANKEGWKQGLIYLNKLYKEGLLDSSSFTQDSNALLALGNNAAAPVLGAFPFGYPAGVIDFVDTGDQRYKDYAVVPPLKGPDGVQLTMIDGNYGPNKATSSFGIYAKSPNKEIAMQIADYLYSEEGTLRADYGEEGVHWKQAAEGELDFEGRPARYEEIAQAEGTTNQSVWQGMGPTFRSKTFRETMAVDQDPLAKDGMELKLYQATKQYEPFAPKEYMTNLFINPDQINSLVQLKTNITRYVKESLVQFIMSTKDIETEWDAYVKQLDKLDVAMYEQINQEAYALKAKK